MDLKEYFVTLSRTTAVNLKIPSPTIKRLVSSKQKKDQTGICSLFAFDGFHVLISYFEHGRPAYEQQTIWVSLALDCDRGMPFSLYDILAFTDPENFKCYTYTYVDSQELMKNCFKEIEEVLRETAPKLKQLLDDGVTKNRIIRTQKDNINNYFGDSIFESGELLGGAADKVIAMMLENFFEAEVECAVVGAQSYFFNGNTEKALKKLKKSKHRTFYLDNLLKHIENGGTSEKASETVMQASAKKGMLRHGSGLKESFGILFFTLVFTIPVALVLVAFYFLLVHILFGDSIITAGVTENIIPIPFFSIPLGLALSINFIKHKNETTNLVDSKSVHKLKSPKAVNELLKYFTICAETLALIGCVTSLFSVTAFYTESVKYAETDFPFSQSECDYSAIEYVAVFDGYYYEDEFVEEKYAVIKTTSGKTIDLYNSTWLSWEMLVENEAFFKEKGIEIKYFQSDKDYENS